MLIMLKAKSILDQDSMYAPYRSKKHTNEAGPSESLIASFETQGILNPLTVHETKNKEYHLLDGFKRFDYLKKKKSTDIACRVLNQTQLNTKDGLILFFTLHPECQAAAPASKAKWVQALVQHIKKTTIRNEFLTLLNLPAQDNILRQCIKISKLPEAICQLSEEKQFSFKQCFHLTRFNVEILNEFARLLPYFNFSASTFLECLERLSDHCRQKKKSATQILNQTSFQSLLHASDTPSEKTKQLREQLQTLRFPELNRLQSQFNSSYKKLRLPSNTHVDWDKSFEEKKLSLTISFTNTASLQKTIDQVSDTDTLTTLSELLETF